MVTCDLCGGEDFEKHEGFMYCATCQTQSQHYYEQEYEYQNHELNISRSLKSKAAAKKPKDQKQTDDGFWTTWEAFNYILHGMTEEIKNCGAGEEVGKMVLKLWAAYVQACKAGFNSKCEDKIPKLGFGFRNRDVRILYNVDLESCVRHSARSRSCSSRNTSISNSSLQSKRSLKMHKGKMVAAEYQHYLNESAQRNSNLADETLESLGMSSDLETSEESLDSVETHLKSLRNILLKKDYKLYKHSLNSKKCKKAAKRKVAVRCPGKNKLLALIHLALLLTGSEIQLSDLLRFIRESHLSFAKVTHFFPKEMKFPKKDFTYIETVTDHIMPSHLAQRKIVGKLARFLKVEEIPTPNMSALIDRYCLDLNLPREVGKLGKKISADCFPAKTVPGYETQEPSYEAWAMSCVIIALKFLLGINDKTEIFLSHLALEINKRHEKSLFVFQDWQKFIECRKAVLMNFHYPTEEQLGESSSSFQSSKNFLGMLMKESKDDHRAERFVRYPRYYIDEGFLRGVKEMLSTLSIPQNVAGFDFKPSLTPQVSNLETIMRDISVEVCDFPSAITSLPENILKQDFKNCDLKFATDPKVYLDLLEEDSDLFAKFGLNRGPSQDSSEGKNKNLDLLLDCSSQYWILRLPEKAVCSLNEFGEEVLNKTPENFQWLIKECARMLEMNVRELYEELLRLEVLVSSGL